MEQTPSLTFSDRVIDIMRRRCNIHFGGNARAFSASIDIDPDSGVVSRWLRGKGAGPTLQKIGPVMDKLGVVLLDPDDPADKCVDTMKHDATIKALRAAEQELEQARLTISQLTGERNAFRDMALALSQKNFSATTSGDTINTNINKNF